MRLSTAVLLLSVSTLLFSACSDIKNSAEYRAVESDYYTIKRQITGESKQPKVAKKLPVKTVKKYQNKISSKIKTPRATKSPIPAYVHNHCNYILRDLSKPNAKTIWCIPRMAL